MFFEAHNRRARPWLGVASVLAACGAPAAQQDREPAASASGLTARPTALAPIAGQLAAPTYVPKILASASERLMEIKGQTVGPRDVTWHLRRRDPRQNADDIAWKLPPPPGVALGVSEPDDGFGSALALGDFNGDGTVDLAAGTPRESFNFGTWAGAVYIYRGFGSGDFWEDLDGVEHERVGFAGWTMLDRWNAGFAPQSYDFFGWALASGDFNDDGYDDLAIGAPGINTPIGDYGGRVQIAWGSASGLSDLETIAHSDAGALPTGEDLFGIALVSGDFDGDGVDDLAIGASGMTHNDGLEAGQVFVMRGSSDGLESWRIVDQQTAQTAVMPGSTPNGQPLGVHEAGDGFGYSLAAGDLNNDGLDDLAVGSPWDREGGAASGSVYVFQSASDTIHGWQRVYQDGPFDDNVAGDQFGWSIVIANLKTANYYTNELIIGAPGEDLEAANANDAGWVYIFERNSGGFQSLYGLGQTGVGKDNDAGDRFGQSMVSYRTPAGPRFLFVSAPGDDREDPDVGEVLWFIRSPIGPLPAGDPTTPDSAWIYGKRAAQRIGRAMAADASGTTFVLSGDNPDDSGVINDYLVGGQPVPALVQETDTYHPADLDGP